MATVVDATVSADQFALQDTFEAVPEAEFETVKIAAKVDGNVVPFVWASAPDTASVHSALQNDSSTESVTRHVERDDRSLYQIEWRDRIRLIVYILGIEDGKLLDARGRDGRWDLRVLFPSHDAVSPTYELCQKHDVDLSIHRVKGVAESIDRSGTELTDKQYEALAASVESDYYHVPRGKSLEDLADELDISHQALSERLRRGHRTLIEQTLR